MATHKGCDIPDDLYFHTGSNVWLRENDDGTFDLGMTDLAQSMAGAVIHCRIKKVGKTVKAGKSLATVESGKWVGPVKAPFTAEVVAKNETVEGDATLLNRSPYKDGWLARLKPADPATAKDELKKGADAIPEIDAYMADHDFTACIHCEGYDGE